MSRHLESLASSGSVARLLSLTGVNSGKIDVVPSLSFIFVIDRMVIISLS